jgi:dolichyl-phosphate beta-glucosyltransferase
MSASSLISFSALFVDLSIVIPAYNEAARITPTLEKLQAFLKAQPMRWEIVVVDDGSTDDTILVVEKLAAHIHGLRVVRSPRNSGKGAAVRRGMLHARGQIRVMCDADGSMPATELPKLLSPIVNCRAEVSIGSRYAPGASSDVKQPLYRRLWSRLCNRVIQRALVPGVQDTQCGFKAFTAEAARDLFGRGRTDGWAFDLEILALAKRRGYLVEEVGVYWQDDARSKVNPIKDAVKVIREAVTIRRNLQRGVYLLDRGVGAVNANLGA